MSFEKYPKMEEGGAGAVAPTTVTGKWLVTEKVHGANFSIVVKENGAGGAAVCFAKRSGVIGWWGGGGRGGDVNSQHEAGPAVGQNTPKIEDFYSVQSQGLLEPLAVAGQSVFAAIRRQTKSTSSHASPTLPNDCPSRDCTAAHDGAAARGQPAPAPAPPAMDAGRSRVCDDGRTRSTQVESVQIFGELYGGRYDHPDVAPVHGLQPIQMGVWYSEELRFLPFDVAVVCAGPSESPGHRTYLDYSDAAAVCHAAGLPFAPTLFTGTLAECLEVPIEFETTIPQMHGLPSLGPANVAEGIVIRPATEPRGLAGRGLFKRKIPAFSEKRYDNPGFAAARDGGTYQLPAAQVRPCHLQHPCSTTTTTTPLQPSSHATLPTSTPLLLFTTA
eukprot:m.228344 g.228344  ORF g.228344 m.228344 type:complete len:387 (-) comp25975_c1_seq2:79-1239(-)